MDEPTKEHSQESQKFRLGLLMGLLLALILLSAEGGIIFVLSILGNIDTNESLLDAATFGATYAYFIAIGVVLICAIILLFKKRPQKNIFAFTAIGMGILMIVFWNIIATIQYGILSVPPSKEVLQFNAIAKILAIQDAPIFSVDHQPLGVHIEYAVQIPNNAPAGGTHWKPFGIESSAYSGNYSTITSNLRVIQDASNTMLGTISPNQSGTALAYGSYDLFPVGVVVNGKDINGNIDFCFDAASTNLTDLNSVFPATDTTSWGTIHNLHDFYFMVSQNVTATSTKIDVYIRSDVPSGDDLDALTNNSYDVKNFYETVAGGTICNS